SVAVWEYLRFSGTWLPYPPEVCEQFEEARKEAGAQRLVFVDSPSIRPHSVDVVGMCQVFGKDLGKTTAGDLGTTPSSVPSLATGSTVRRMLYPADSAPGQGVSWQWQANNRSTWYTYSTPIVCLIEKLRSQGQSQVNLQNYHPECIYTLDLTAMMQRNNFSGFCRSVRRLDGLRRYPPSCDAAPSPAPCPAPCPAPERSSKPATTTRRPDISVTAAHWPVFVKSTTGPSSRRPSIFTHDRATSASGARNHRRSQQVSCSQSLSRLHRSNRLEWISLDLFHREEFLSAHTLDAELPLPEEDCCICQEPLGQHSTYGDSSRVVRLRQCGHPLHYACLTAMWQSNPQAGHLQCPMCKTLHGVKSGNQPEGRMSCTLLPVSLEGYEGCGTIEITYHIGPGIQGPEHPHPGRPYTARGFPRHGYLPDNDEGRQAKHSALALLATAWDRRLVFTVGRSTTTGEEDTVTWNEIHHKTQMRGGAHGYPDPDYLGRLLAELETHGVTPHPSPQSPDPPPKQE
ncbi:unnamed protein product, partial [Ixodes hexagonus]